MKNLKRYGNATDVADAVGMERRTLAHAMDRDDPILDLITYFRGRKLVSVASAKRYAENPPKRGRKKKK